MAEPIGDLIHVVGGFSRKPPAEICSKCSASRLSQHVFFTREKICLQGLTIQNR